MTVAANTTRARSLRGAGEGQDEAAHLLIVDDDARLRDLLRKFLSENGYRVTMAADAADARTRLAGIAFDLIVLDVMMPGESGLELTASLRTRSDVPVLLLTARGETEHRIAGLESGADDYLAKPFEPRELLLRIGTILRRTAAQQGAPGELRMGEVSFDPARGDLRKGETHLHLTSAERALLLVFAARPGVVIDREALMAESGVSGGTRSIDVQITRLRRKIEPDHRLPRYLQTVRGQGYVLRPD
ncbi:MAG: response regulator [Alphaproteobacteria bacterium]